MPNTGSFQTQVRPVPEARGKAAAISAYLAQGGNLISKGGRRGKGFVYSQGKLKGKTQDQALQEAEALWDKAPSEIREKYATRAGLSALSDSERRDQGFVSPARPSPPQQTKGMTPKLNRDNRVSSPAARPISSRAATSATPMADMQDAGDQQDQEPENPDIVSGSEPESAKTGRAMKSLSNGGSPAPTAATPSPPSKPSGNTASRWADARASEMASAKQAIGSNPASMDPKSPSFVGPPTSLAAKPNPPASGMSPLAQSGFSDLPAKRAAAPPGTAAIPSPPSRFVGDAAPDASYTLTGMSSGKKVFEKGIAGPRAATPDESVRAGRQMAEDRASGLASFSGDPTKPTAATPSPPTSFVPGAGYVPRATAVAGPDAEISADQYAAARSRRTSPGSTAAQDKKDFAVESEYGRQQMAKRQDNNGQKWRQRLGL